MEVTAYRGQYGLKDVKIHTKLKSITFSDLQSAIIYAYEPNCRTDVVIKPIVISATIQINNPVIHTEQDCFADFKPLVEKLGEEFMWKMAEKHDCHICATNNWQENYAMTYGSIETLRSEYRSAINDLYMDAYPLLDDEEFVDYAKSLGYDGAIHLGNNVTEGEKEYPVFDEEQIMVMKAVDDEIISEMKRVIKYFD